MLTDWLDLGDEESRNRRWHTSGSPPQLAGHLSFLLSPWPALPSEPGFPSSNVLLAEIYTQKAELNAHNVQKSTLKHICTYSTKQRHTLKYTQTEAILPLPTDETILLKMILRLILLMHSEDKLKWFQITGCSNEKMQEAKHKLTLNSYGGKNKKQNT